MYVLLRRKYILRCGYSKNYCAKLIAKEGFWVDIVAANSSSVFRENAWCVQHEQELWTRCTHKYRETYRDSITATSVRHAIPIPRAWSLRLYISSRKRTGALVSAVNCAPVIQTKAVVLSAARWDECSLRLSNNGSRLRSASGIFLSDKNMIDFALKLAPTYTF